MRVLFVIPEFPPHTGGGILKHYTLLTSALARSGIRVSVVVASPYSSFDDYVTDDGVEVRFVPARAVESRAAGLAHLAAAPLFKRYIAAALAASDIVERLAASIDVIETTDFGLLFAPLVLLESRPPLVVKMHGSIGQIAEHEPVHPKLLLDTSLATFTEASLLAHCDHLVAYSPGNAAEWSQRLGTSVSFVPPPMPHQEPQVPVLPSSGFSGLVAGRIQSWKGPHTLCDALHRLGSRAPADLKIAWAGRDTDTAPDNESMSAWLASTFPAIWGPRVTPLGERPHVELLGLQRGVRYMLVPSSWDAFNYTVVESMAAGSVAVVSSGAGASYLIEDGINGFAFPADDAADLAEQLLRVHALGAPDRRRIGDAARETVIRHLDPDTVARATLDEFRKARRRALPPGATSWIHRVLAGDGRSTGTDDAFLENVSIRALGRHLGSRLIRRVSG